MRGEIWRDEDYVGCCRHHPHRPRLRSEQDYQIVPASRREELLRDRAVVISGHVSHVTNYMGHLAGQPPKKHDLTITADRVEKGRYDAPSLKLRGLRPLSTAEDALLPGPHARTFPNARFLIGYDRRRNDRLLE